MKEANEDKKDDLIRPEHEDQPEVPLNENIYAFEYSNESISKLSDLIVTQFTDHDGALIPLIKMKESNKDETILEHLHTFLSSNGVEVLKYDSSIKIYTKLYTAEEMQMNKVEEFHPGHSIRTFFEKFQFLLKSIDVSNYEEFKFFLSDTETIDDLLYPPEI